MSFRRPSSEAKEHSGVVKFFFLLFCSNNLFLAFYLASHDLLLQFYAATRLFPDEYVWEKIGAPS